MNKEKLICIAIAGFLMVLLSRVAFHPTARAHFEAKKTLQTFDYLPETNSDIFDWPKNVQPPFLGEPGNWIENTTNWIKIMDVIQKETISANYEELRSLSFDEKPSQLGAFVMLAGSMDGYRIQAVEVIESLTKQFLQYYNYPVFIFNFNLLEEQKKQILSYLSPDMQVEFIKLDHNTIIPKVTDKSSNLNTDPVGPPSPAGTISPEYKFQSQFFVETIFRHPKLRDFKYLFRIDTDIKFVFPPVVDLFEVMNSNNLLFSFHHWGYEPAQYSFVTKYLNEFSEYFIKSSPNAFFPQVGIEREKYSPKTYARLISSSAKAEAIERLERIPPLFSGGGCFTITSGPYIRRLPVAKYIDAYIHSGAIWTHRWAEQSFLPRIAALFLANPHNSSYLFQDIELLHHNALQQPSREQAPWPKQKTTFPRSIALENKERIKKWSRKATVAIIYHLSENDPNEKNQLLKSLRNLKENVLFPMKLRMQNADVFIFYAKKVEWIKEAETITLLKLQFGDEFNLKMIETLDATKYQFFSYHMFKEASLSNFEIFMTMNTKTNIVTPLNWNVFEMFAKYKLYLGYHRWYLPIHGADAEQEKVGLRFDVDAMKIIDREILKMNSTNPEIPPEMCYHDYMMIGAFEFYRSQKYLEFAEEALRTQGVLDRVSHGCVLLHALVALEPHPITKIFHLGQIYLNFKQNDDSQPFRCLNGWPEKHDTPMWRLPEQPFPTVYKNYPPLH